MAANRIETGDDLEALVLGLGFFSTGGGGLAERGRRLMEGLLADGFDVSWVPLDDVDQEALICSVYGMGSIAPHAPMTDQEMEQFGVRGELHPRPWLRAVDELEEYLGERIDGIVPLELGPSNTIVALDAAARSGRLIIDGDHMGRALPRMSQALPAVLGLQVWPLTICDPWGNALIMKDCPSAAVAERVGKMVSRVTKAVATTASCSHAAFPNTVRELTPAIVPGTLSRSLEVGRRVQRARADGADPVTEATEAGAGCVLFGGVVSDRTWEDTAEGYMEGTTVLSGTGEDEGATAEVWFQNEHHIIWRDDTIAAMSPDIIAVVDSGSAEPFSNTELEKGQPVAVLGFRSPSAYRSGPALQVTSPRHYGFDFDWSSVEDLNPHHPWT